MLVLPEGMSDPMYWALCDAMADLPLPLAEADLSKPFVYERRWGVFYVPFGHHPGAMSLLLAFQHGLRDGIDAAERLGLSYSDGTADHWLEHTPGAAFRSSVGKTIQIGRWGGLSPLERRYFAGATAIFD